MYDLLGVSSKREDANGGQQPTYSLLLMNMLMHYPDVLSRNWRKWACCQAWNWIQLSWSQVDCISKLCLCFLCAWTFPRAVLQHGTSALTQYEDAQAFCIVTQAQSLSEKHEIDSAPLSQRSRNDREIPKHTRTPGEWNPRLFLHFKNTTSSVFNP